MIRTAILLARTSLLSVLFLAAALLTLVSIWSDVPDEAAETGPDLAAALAPIPKRHANTSDGPAALRIALFDPERRPESVAGSIDDLRGVTASPPPAPVNIALSGVLLDGHKARAMLGVIGGPASWNEVGAEIGGWRVASIDATGAVLEHDDLVLTLKVADLWKAHGQPRSATEAAPQTATSPPDPGGAPSGTPQPVDTLVAPDPVESSKP